jgi:hypothetical protein
MRQMSLETFARARAQLDAGLDREVVLAEASVDAPTWTREEESLLSELADEVERADFVNIEAYRRAYRAAWAELTEVATPDVPPAVENSTPLPLPAISPGRPPLLPKEEPTPSPQPLAEPLASPPVITEATDNPLNAPVKSPLPAWVERISAVQITDETLLTSELTERAKDPLPFTAPSSDPADEEITLVPAEYSATATGPVQVLAIKNPLPFQPSPLPATPRQESGAPYVSPPPPAPRNSSPEATALKLPWIPGPSPLPFRNISETPARPLAGDVPAATSPTDTARGSAGNPALRLTLEQYASLCAEIVVFPQRVEAIFLRYGLISQKERLAVDLAWQERLRRNATEYHEWQVLYQHYQAYWADSTRHDKPR